MQFGFCTLSWSYRANKIIQDYTLPNLIFISAGAIMRSPELNTPVLILEAAFNHFICAVTNQTHIPNLKNCWKGKAVTVVWFAEDTNKKHVMKPNFRNIVKYGGTKPMFIWWLNHISKHGLKVPCIVSCSPTAATEAQSGHKGKTEISLPLFDSL